MNRTINRTLAVLGGIGAGLAAAYFLDPKKGSERRAKFKDKATSLTSDAREAFAQKLEDFKETASGYANEAKALLGSGEEKHQAGFTPSASGRSAKQIH